MTDLNKLIGSLASSGAVSGFAGGLLGGALTSKKGRKMAGSALKLGAVAAVGGLAYSAYRRYQENSAADQGRQPQGAQAVPPEWSDVGQERFVAAIEANGGQGGLLLVRAMIAAAFADGHLDAGEQGRIFAEVDNMKLSTTERALLFDELRNPLSMPELVEQVASPELATEVYAASLVAIDQDAADGKLYLKSLAMALSLPDELVTSIHEQAALAVSEDRAA